LPEEKERTSTDEQTKMVLKLLEEGRLGDWITRGMILKGVITLVILILIVVFRNSIISALSDWLIGFRGLIQNQTQALIVANYLLLGLIVVTILAEFIPNLISWFNRPKVYLSSIDHAHNGYLRVKKTNHQEERLGISIITASLRNSGRGTAMRPVLNVAHMNYKISSITPSQTETILADKSITILPATVYSFNGDYDDLAIQFIKKGMKTVESIPGSNDGRRLILGFAFEGGDSFYFASLDAAFLDKVKLGETKQRLSLKFYARNSPRPKTLKTNIPATFQSWNAVKFDYRRIEGPPPETKAEGVSSS
jgi:hypothetical protein